MHVLFFVLRSVNTVVVSSSSIDSKSRISWHFVSFFYKLEQVNITYWYSGYGIFVNLEAMCAMSDVEIQRVLNKQST